MFIGLTERATEDLIMINATQIACAQPYRIGDHPTRGTRVTFINQQETLVVEESVEEIHDRIREALDQPEILG